MPSNNLSVREMQASDIDLIVRYWLESAPAHLSSMGVDLNKLPSREQLAGILQSQLSIPLSEKRAYCIIWMEQGRPIGHCNTNPTSFGEVANMHLHLWDHSSRQKGKGFKLVKMSLPWFFNKLQLKKLVCEPYAMNPAPNRTMETLGFELVKEYVTIPGSLNFEQPVKRWELTADRFRELYE